MPVCLVFAREDRLEITLRAERCPGRGGGGGGGVGGGGGLKSSDVENCPGRKIDSTEMRLSGERSSSILKQQVEIYMLATEIDQGSTDWEQVTCQAMKETKTAINL